MTGEQRITLNRLQQLIVLAMALSLAVAVPAVSKAAADGDREVAFTLTVLHSNDGESQLINAGEGIEDFGGAARFATVLRQLRENAGRPGGHGRLHRGLRPERGG